MTGDTPPVAIVMGSRSDWPTLATATANEPVRSRMNTRGRSRSGLPDAACAAR